jgi:hypothetical protein
MDVLGCELEFSTWAATGTHHDIVVMAGRQGVSISGFNDQHAMAGITGGSAYQDYMIKSVRARRDITIYGCCPDPYPTLIYELEFTRSGYFYYIKLFLPSIAITFVSFLTFFLDPTTGERLGFGMAVILAVIMNDVVATSMMPVCEATVLMDYVSLICLVFAVFSLIETGLVLNLYFRADRSWLHFFSATGKLQADKRVRPKIQELEETWTQTTGLGASDYSKQSTRIVQAAALQRNILLSGQEPLR